MPFFSATKLNTIDRHISEQMSHFPHATGEFTNLMHDLTLAIRIISSEVRRAGLNDILGLTENINVHGEKVRKLDEYANEIIYRAMDHSGTLCVMASEESKGIIPIPENFKKGKYVLVFDPLDGSSNIDVNITTGTIFSIYSRINPESEADGSAADILQPGFKQAAAAYVLYGSSTTFVYTTGNGVNVFTYDPTIGEFLLTYENLKIPKKGYYYSCNEANFYKWDNRIREYITFLKTNLENREQYKMRYVASAVADIHRTLHYGGIYLYPSDKELPDGKIRLVYEANPLAMIVEQAGGKAISEKSEILNIQPKLIHERVQFFAGSPENIIELKKFLDE